MSGRHISIDSQKLGRRGFLKQVASLVAVPLALPSLTGCSDTDKHRRITGSIVGANHKVGHLLRAGDFPAPTQKLDVEILIIGSGISGLSAKRWLLQNGVSNVLMLEMDSRPGGNSVGGANSVSAYPWGAHYLPIPDVANVELIDFLKSIDVIRSFDTQGLPVYNEYYLCHDPEERLYINGHWQEGLIPQFGVSAAETQQIARFLNEIETMRTTMGNDGRPCFRIPIDTSSADEAFRMLDKISFDQYLTNNGYDSKHLRWYLEYCCKDDYGTTLKQTSAWAGLHYFASRRGAAANAPASAVLTWPEGNAFLMNALKQQAPENIKTSMLAHSLRQTENGVEVLCYDTNARTCISITAKKALMCTPQYVTKRILGDIAYPALQASYAPWIVANVTLDRFPHQKGYPLCWDNVIYGQESVGYVFANHQNLAGSPKGVLTYYLPIAETDAAAARNTLHNKTYEHWRDRVINDLEDAHPGIAKCISNIDVWIWGHGMVRPSMGYIWCAERQNARQPIDNKIFFAHTDLSGISIFEEGFYQGINAAKQILRSR